MDARFLALADNASVATWASRAGGLYGATAAGTAQPTYKARSVNGQPAVRFDGTSDCMDFDVAVRALTNNVAGIVAICVAVVDNAAADSNQNLVFLSSGSSAASGRFVLRAVVSGVAQAGLLGRRTDADTLATTSAIPGATSSPVVIQGFADWVGNLLAGRTNGGNQGSAVFSSGGGNSSATSSVAAKLGGQDATQVRFSGRMCAVVIGTPLIGQPVRMRVRQSFGFSFKIATG